MRQSIPKSAYLTIGREYVVLAISVYLGVPSPQTKVQLLTDVGGRVHGMFDLADFEITDDRPSRFWRVRFADSHLLIQPELWMAPWFWETFHNDGPAVPVPDAVERFDKAVRALLEEAGAVWKDEPPPWSNE